jgi:hypothetical protein
MRTLALSSLLGLVAFAAPRRAGAVAHHEQVVVQKLRDAKNKVVGARVHMIVDPEEYNRVRINIGKLQIDPKDKPNDTHHREVAAGMKPGYVRFQLGELQNLKLKPTQTSGWGAQHELQEVKLDLFYGQGNDPKPGEKVDLYTTFNHLTKNPSYWHVYGMHDGPVNRNDTTHVHDLPSETSAHGEATEQAP